MGKLISKPIRALRKTVTDNLRERIDVVYPNMSLSEAFIRLGRDAGGLSFSTVQRIMKGETGASIDTLALLCVPLGCTPAWLVTPSENPPARKRIRAYIDDVEWARQAGNRRADVPMPPQLDTDGE
jgi:transcriptional regulator with XRE-family HTH domain